MNKVYRFAALLLGCASMIMCGCNPVDGPSGPDNPEKDPRSALERYWEDSYGGEWGIQIKDINIDGESVPRMYLADKPLYVTGMNCYNLFVQCHEANSMKRDNMEETVAVLEKEQVPIVRFSCSPFYSSQFHYYFDDKEKYLANLDSLGALCDRAHIALIPSVFWNTASVPDYYGEPFGAWGNTSSKTYAHMLSYTEDIVRVLSKHKSLVMWEFGNEFNLAADIEMAGYAPLPASAVETAYKGFAEKVLSLDPQKRVVATGNSVMRNSQYNQMATKTWGTDTWEQYKEVTRIMTPEPMLGISEHLYEEARAFADKGTVNRTEQIQYAKQVAKELGKGYYIGEFTGPATAKGDSLMIRRHFISYYAQRVQISLMWNYALKGDIEWSFRADTPYGNMAFNLMREYNERFKTVKE